MAITTKQLRFLAWVITAGIFLYIQLNSLSNSFLEEFPDSSRYFSPTDLLSPENAGIAYSFFVRAFDLIPGIDATQILLSAVSWGILSFSALLLFPSWVGLLSSWTVLFLGLQQSVTNWNNLLLSESLSISATAIWLASLLLVLHQSRQGTLSWTLGIFQIAASVFLLMNKPQAIIAVLPVLIALLIANWNHFRRGMKITFITVISSLTIAAVWRLIFISTSSPFANAYTQHLLENRKPFLAWAFASAGCSVTPGVAGSSFHSLIAGCVPLADLIEEGKVTFTQWFLQQPLEALASFASWFQTDAVVPNYSSAPTVIESAQANWILGVGYPLSTSLLFYSLAALGIILIHGYFQGFNFSVNRFLVALGFLLTVVAYIFLTWGVDGIEMPRHTLPFSLFLPLFLAGSMLWVMRLDRNTTAKL